MLREREKTFIFLFSTIDFILTFISLGIASLLRTGEVNFTANRELLILYLVTIGIWYLSTKLHQLHYLQRIRSFAGIMVDYLFTYAICLAVILLVIFLLNLGGIDHKLFILFNLINFILLYSTRVLVSAIFDRFRAKGFNTRNILVIADEKAGPTIEKLLKSPKTGLVLKGIITGSERIANKYSDRFPIFPSESVIAQLLDEEPIDELFYCKKDMDEKEMREMMYTCQEVGVVFRIKSALFDMLSSQSKIYFLDETPFITITNLPDRYIYLMLKRLFDITVSLLALVAASPLMLAIAIAIKCTSKGPVFYKQVRTGRRGREFMLYKFRTMVANSDELRNKLEALNEMDGPVFKIKNDPRITKVGRLLRKTSLDELPQFWNVLKAQMSIVGPRPPLPKEVVQYERWQLRRIAMKPGITCIWQVSGRNDTTFEEWMRMDLEYIDNWSLKLDLILCLQTVRAVVKMNGH